MANEKIILYYWSELTNIHLQFRQMSSKELCHSESSNFFGSEDLCHLLVGSEVLLVLSILEVMFLQVSPQFLDALSSRCFLCSNDVSKIIGKLHWLRDSRLLFCWFVGRSFIDGTRFLCCFRHFELIRSFGTFDVMFESQWFDIE